MITSFLLVSSIIIHCPLVLSQSFYSSVAGQGQWQFLQESIGISAMHMQLLSNNKVVMFDRTDFGTSNISLPYGRCRFDSNDTTLKTDCSAHSVLYDYVTNTLRPLMIDTDTWCSSGSVLPNGTLVQTGGFNDGDHVVRTFTPCEDDSCDWIEYHHYLAERRWYATNQILPDGRIIIIGGRRQSTYEFFPSYTPPTSSASSFWLNFLDETRDEDENNLYPFVHLLPDGNLFIFANHRAISLDYDRNHVVKEFPSMDAQFPRNYPSSGSSVLLPVDENQQPDPVIEIMICGGAPQGSYRRATKEKVFTRATNTCGRLVVSDNQNSSWNMEDMPMARVMGDMLLLPSGDIIIINGAELGTAGWENAQDPAMRPLIYRPTNSYGQRFSVMYPSRRPRMYHSSAILLPDGRVLVGGSNPHVYYNFTNVVYPTDLSLESYSPPYLSQEYSTVRPKIIDNGIQVVGYGSQFSVTFSVESYITASVVSVSIIAPSFTTHSLAMNQRTVVLKTYGVSQVLTNLYKVDVIGPSKATIAPPGYYMLFVVHAGIPSSGIWVNVQ